MSDDTSQINPQDTDDIESQTVGLYANFILGAVTTTLSLILFEIFRRKIPSIFEARRTLNERAKPLDYYNNRVYSPPSPSYRPFGWLHPILHLDIDTLAKTHGLDTALYLRYLRTMIILFTVLLIPSVPLLPVYYTGTFNDDRTDPNDDAVIGIQQFSLSNVSRDDKWRFWVTLAADYFVVIFVLLVVYREFTKFAKYRIQYRASNNPSNYAILVEDIPKAEASETTIFNYWNRLFPGTIKRVFLIRNGKKMDKMMKDFWTALASREKAEWKYAYNPKLRGDRPQHKVGKFACFFGTRVDSIEYWTNEQQKRGTRLTALQQSPDISISPPTRAAVVVFDSKSVASVAAQTNYSSRHQEWSVIRAPEPYAIKWKSFSIPGYQNGVRNTITIILSMALTILWIIPITFIMSLTSLKSLANLEINDSKPFDFLNNLLNWSKRVTELIESLLPAIILSVFLALVPVFLRLFISVSRVSSNASVDVLVRDWYFNFVVFSNFVYILVSGSLLNKISEIVNEPSQIVSFLAATAPKQGAFLMNFIILKALSETPKEILQIGRMVVRYLVLKFISKTKREIDNATVGNTEFQFFRYYAISQLICLLGLIYSTISPFIIPCCLLYFIMMYIVWKYNLCFALHNQYEDGGMMYGGALYGTWIGIFLHLLTMIGIFGLNKNPAQSVLIIIPAAATLAFLRMIRSSFPRIIQHGSAYEALKRTEESEESDEITEELAEKYIHPAFMPLPDPIENLNGVEEFAPADSIPGITDVEKAGGTSKQESKQQDNDDIGGKDIGAEDPSYISGEGKTKSMEEWVDAANGADLDGKR